MTRYARRMRLLSAAAMVVVVAACDDRAGTVDAPPPAPLAELEGASSLPYAEPARVQYYEPERGYQWAERAYGLQRSVHDAPPDYGFYYDDEVSPYVWETADDWTLYAEPSAGDYRYYYYEPGAARPYFIRDHDYGYAYDPAGLLIAVFYADGRYAPRDVVLRNAPLAGRYYARGYDLRRTSYKARRTVVEDRVWLTEAPRVTRAADPWLRAARDDRRWREWRARDGDRELRRFEAETRRRQDATQRWREQAGRQQAAIVERREDRRDAQVQEIRRDAVRDERRDQRAERQADRVGAQQAQRRAVVEQREQARATQARAEGERRQQAQVQRDRQARGAENERRQAEARSQADSRREQAAQQRQAEVRQRQTQQGEQRQAQARERQQQARAERQAERAQARAPAAADSGQPAAARERGRPDAGKTDAGKNGAGKDRGGDERRKD